MYNLLIAASPETWELSPYTCDIARFCEHTIPEIKEQFQVFEEESINRLKLYPCLFMVENEAASSKIGYIDDITLLSQKIKVKYHFDPIFQPIPSGKIFEISLDLGLGKLELYRTHWAIKNVDLLAELKEANLITREQIESSQRLNSGDNTVQVSAKRQFDATKIFIVHGRDNASKQEMARFIEQLDLKPVILHEQANQGMTIIEKIESYSDVGFAVVLYTPCDTGALNCEALQGRARQNVVFEHGYLIGRLGRKKVCAFVKGEVEIPNDISGLLYITMDDPGAWKASLVRELQGIGYDVVIESK